MMQPDMKLPQERPIVSEGDIGGFIDLEQFAPYKAEADDADCCAECLSSLGPERCVL